MMIGEPNCDFNGTNTGCVDIWTRSGATWSFSQRIAASTPRANGYYGDSISLSGDRAIIGSPGFDWLQDGTREGGAYFLTRGADGRWSEQQRLTVSGTVEMGEVVAMRGDVLAVSAPGTKVGGKLRVGTLYVYAFDGASWVRKASLSHPSGEAYSALGSSIAFFGDEIVVGARRTTVGTDTVVGSLFFVNRFGSAYVLNRWHENPDPVAGAEFGSAIGVATDMLLVGAASQPTLPLLGPAIPQNGRVYMFRRR